MKQAAVYMKNVLAGVLTEDENGYLFEYDYTHDCMPPRSRPASEVPGAQVCRGGNRGEPGGYTGAVE